jgi:hypothetical protein
MKWRALTGIAEGERAEQHAVDQREDGGRGADAEREHEHGNADQPTVASERAAGQPDIVAKQIDTHPVPHPGSSSR